MRKIHLIFAFILAVSEWVACQNAQTNLEKYWRYRQRLRDKFIIISPNVEEPGVNIPATSIDVSNSIIQWGDGNENFSHYLSILATEYKLLKNNGQDYKQTIKELLYALCAIERLDWYSESYERNNTVYSSDLNGFFIRDDVTQSYFNKYKSVLGVVDYTSVFRGSGDAVPKQGMSQDNIYHLLEGLSLVKKLVDNENISDIALNFSTTRISGYLAQKGIMNSNTVNFSLWAQDIVRRVIRNMQHSSPEPEIVVPYTSGNPFNCAIQPAQTAISLFSLGIISFGATKSATSTGACLTSRWYIKYPVQNRLVEEGSGIDFDTYFFYSYGLANAGQSITGENFHFNNSSGATQEYIFKNLLNGNIQAAASELGEYINWVTYVLSLTTYVSTGDPLSAISDYDDYKIRSLATTGNVGGASTFSILRNRRNTYVYEHFPLYYLILHGDNNYSLDAINSSDFIVDRAFYENILDKAPCSGNRSYATNDLDAGYNDNWSSVSRLIWPEKLKTDIGVTEYSGMDYMLLHNLYYLGFLRWDFMTVNVTESYPRDVQAGNIVSTAQITGSSLKSTNGVPENQPASYTASGKITLKQGFSAKYGVTFTAKTGNLCGTYNANNYRKVSYSNCPSGGIQKSAEFIIPETSENKNISESDIFPDQKITLYPNPAGSKIFINGLSGFHAEIYDLSGRKVINKIVNGKEIDISQLDRGTYLIQLFTGNKGYTKKFVKQ